jgi:hypothetical protein
MNDRPTLGTPNVGDTVIVLVLRHRQETEVIEATITKVARLFVTITENANNRPLYEGQIFRPRTWRMRMTTQHEDSNYVHYDRFVTPGQYAWDQRDSAARAYLREVGVSIDSRSLHRDDPAFPVTLANLIRGHNGLDTL